MPVFRTVSFGAIVKAAGAESVAEPMLLYCSGSMHAKDVRNALPDRPKDATGEPPLFHVVPLDVGITLLREDVGPAGIKTAEFVQGAPPGYRWMVLILEEGIFLTAYSGERLAVQQCVPYEDHNPRY